VRESVEEEGIEKIGWIEVMEAVSSGRLLHRPRMMEPARRKA